MHELFLVLLTLIGWMGASKHRHRFRNFSIQLPRRRWLISVTLSPRRKRGWGESAAKVAAFPWRRVNSCTRLLTSTRCLNISEGRTLTQCTSCCHGSETLCARHRNMEQPLCKNWRENSLGTENTMDIFFCCHCLYVERGRERMSLFINLRQLLFQDECQ